MKFKIVTLLTFIFFSVHANAQDIEPLIKSVCDSLLIARTGSIKNNCIYDSESGIPLSCFIIEGKPEWITDFDGDGEQDLLIYVMDEGLGGGGNAFGYEYMVAIMKNEKIHELHSIFGGGRFSYALLEVSKVENGKIYATYEENPASRENINEEHVAMQKISLTFHYQDNKMVEESYLNCPIAEMDKRIFRDDLPYKTQRNSQLNDLYEVEQQERIYLDDTNQDYISASLHGCRNIYIRFNYDIPYSESTHKSIENRKEILFNFLKFLQHNSRYKSTIALLNKKVETTFDADIDKSDNSLNKTYTLPNNWEGKIFMNKYTDLEGEKIVFTLNLSKYLEKEKNEFWDEIKR